MDDRSGKPGQKPGGLDLEITRSLAASPGDVYAAWTSVQGLAGWWPPEGFVVPADRSGFHPVPGGSYRACMVDPATGAELWWSGEFGAVRPPSHLSFSLLWEADDGPAGPRSQVEVDFTEHDGGTRQEFRQGTFPSRSARDDTAARWQDAFDRLALYLARQAGQGR